MSQHELNGNGLVDQVLGPFERHAISTKQVAEFASTRSIVEVRLVPGALARWSSFKFCCSVSLAPSCSTSYKESFLVAFGGAMAL
jgi:hypothetical protein